MHSGRALASVTVTARQGDRLAHESSYAGHGRTYGSGSVFTEDGRLVASFVQDNLVRPPCGPRPGQAALPA